MLWQEKLPIFVAGFNFKEMAKKLYTDKSAKDEYPWIINDGEVLTYLQTNEIDSKHVIFLKKISGYTDDIISGWLDVSVKTLRSYKNTESQLKDNIKERVLLLISLMNHGIAVFGTNTKFDQWLNTGNYFFDGKTPVSFLNTITGMRFVDDRITAMEFGDNV